MARTKQNSEEEGNYRKRCSNWMLVALFLKNLTKEEVLLCFEFGEDIGDQRVKRNLFKLFDNIASDAKLPPIAREFVGLHLGQLPTGGLEFDIELFKELFHKYIRVNMENENKPGFEATKINKHVINPLLKTVLEECRRKMCDPFSPEPVQYTKQMARCFRNRWFICREKGVLLEPPAAESFLGPALKLTQYALDRKYPESFEQAQWDNDSVTVASEGSILRRALEDMSSSDMSTMPQKSNLPALLVKYSVMRELNPFYPSHDYFLRLVGVHADFVSKTHRRPIMTMVHSVRALCEKGELTDGDVEELCKDMMDVFVSSGELSAIRHIKRVALERVEGESSVSKDISSDPPPFTYEDVMTELCTSNATLSSVDYTYATLLFQTTVVRTAGDFQPTLPHDKALSLIDEVLIRSGCRVAQTKEDLDQEMALLFGIAETSTEDDQTDDHMTSITTNVSGIESDNDDNNSVDFINNSANDETELVDNNSEFAYASVEELQLALLDDSSDEPYNLVTLPIYEEFISGSYPNLTDQVRCMYRGAFENESSAITVEFAQQVFREIVEILAKEADNFAVEEGGHDIMDTTSGDDAQTAVILHHGTLGHAGAVSQPVQAISADVNLAAGGESCSHLSEAVPAVEESTMVVVTNEPLLEPSSSSLAVPTVVNTTRDNQQKRKTASISSPTGSSSPTPKHPRSSAVGEITTDPNRASAESSTVVPASKPVTTRSTSQSILTKSASPSEMQHFLEKTLPYNWQKYGAVIRKLNAGALKLRNGETFASAQLARVSTRTTKKPADDDDSVDENSTSITDMFFHILNQHSSSTLYRSTVCKYFKSSTYFNIALNKMLKARGVRDRYAIVEVRGDGTCLMNSILTSLYMMKWFQLEKPHVKGGLIQPLHLKRYAVAKIAMNCNRRQKSDSGESFLSMYRTHHPHGLSYLTRHPYNVLSLQDECDSVVIDAQCKDASLYTKRVAVAIQALASVSNGMDEKTLSNAASVVDEHVQKFKDSRIKVYTDFFRECKEGTLLQTDAEEMQLRIVWELLGITGLLYEGMSDTWQTFNVPPGCADSDLLDNAKQLTVIIMKDFNHYFAVVDLKQLTDEYKPTPREHVLCSSVKVIRNYPTEQGIVLTSEKFADRIHDIVSCEWDIEDRKADIYKHRQHEFTDEVSSDKGDDSSMD